MKPCLPVRKPLPHLNSFFKAAFVSSLFFLITNKAVSQCQTVSFYSATSTGILGSVSNGSSATDGDLGTSATINSGLVATNVSLIANLSQPANPGDTILVYYSIPTANLANWGSLGNATFTGNSAANGGGSSTGSTNSGTIGFVIQIGQTSLTRNAFAVNAATYSVTVNFTGISFVNNANPGIAEIRVVPGPPTASATTACYNSTSTITVNKSTAPGNSTTITLYNSSNSVVATNTFANSGASSANNTLTFTTPNLTSNTTYYAVDNATGCTSTGYPYIQTLPNAVEYSPSVQTPIPITVRPQLTGTIGVNCPANSNTASTLKIASTNATGITSYTWSASNGGAVYSTDTHLANPRIVNAPGTFSVTIIDGNGCTGTFTQALTPTNTGCAVLPVMLDSFVVKAVNCSAVVTWKGTIENNLNYYEVQQSADGNNFTTAQKVYAKGSGSSYNIQFAFTVNNEYVRLKMVDNGGRITYSDILSVNNNCISATTPLLHPNPVSSILTISNLGIGNKTIQIVSISGSLVYTSQTQDQQINVNTQNWAPGVYIVSIKDSDTKSHNFKIVKL